MKRPLAAALLCLPSAASAECLSDSCYQGLALLVYGGAATIALLVAGLITVIFRKTRRLGIGLLLAGAALGVAVAVLID